MSFISTTFHNFYDQPLNTTQPGSDAPKVRDSKLTGTRNEDLHPLLKNAKVLESDYPLVRQVFDTWASVMNFSVVNTRPVLSFFSLFSKSHLEYKHEIEAIDLLPQELKEEIANNTKVYGGEKDKDYQKLCKTRPEEYQTKVVFYDKSDSLGAARKERLENSAARIAITNFANGVHVGGSDGVGGKGSQEEQLFRSTYLRVSLERAYQESDSKTRSNTGRYIGYFSAVVSRDVPTIKNISEKFFYVSAAAPDLRKFLRSEGTYINSQANPTALVESILHRKLSVIMAAAVEEKCDTLVLGAFGAGAFLNDPEVVARIINDLIAKDFKGCFSKVVLPIGPNDRNRGPFEKVFNA